MYSSLSGEFWKVLADSIPYGLEDVNVVGDFLARTSGESLLYSLDGSEWMLSHRLAGNKRINNIKFADSTYVAIGEKGSCYTASTIRTDWEEIKTPGTWNLNVAINFKGRWLLGGNNGALLIAKPIQEPVTERFYPQLRISIDGMLIWEPQEAPIVVEDSKDLVTWSVLSRVDTGIGEYNPPVNSETRYFRLREAEEQ